MIGTSKTFRFFTALAAMGLLHCGEHRIANRSGRNPQADAIAAAKLPPGTESPWLLGSRSLVLHSDSRVNLMVTEAATNKVMDGVDIGSFLIGDSEKQVSLSSLALQPMPRVTKNCLPVRYTGPSSETVTACIPTSTKEAIGLGFETPYKIWIQIGRVTLARVFAVFPDGYQNAFDFETKLAVQNPSVVKAAVDQIAGALELNGLKEGATTLKVTALGFTAAVEVIVSKGPVPESVNQAASVTDSGIANLALGPGEQFVFVEDGVESPVGLKQCFHIVSTADPKKDRSKEFTFSIGSTEFINTYSGVKEHGCTRVSVPGRYTIVAHRGGRGDDISTIFTVIDATLSSLSIQPSSMTLDAGQIGSFRVLAQYSNDQTYDVTNRGISCLTENKEIAEPISCGQVQASFVLKGNTKIQIYMSDMTPKASLPIQVNDQISNAMSPPFVLVHRNETVAVHGYQTSDSALNPIASEELQPPKDLPAFLQPITDLLFSGRLAAKGTLTGVNTVSLGFAARGKKANLKLVAAPGDIVSVKVVAPYTLIPVGFRMPVKAFAYYSDGTNVDVTDSGMVRWTATEGTSAGAPSAAEVEQNPFPYVKALAAGIRTIKASIDVSGGPPVSIVPLELTVENAAIVSGSAHIEPNSLAVEVDEATAVSAFATFRFSNGREVSLNVSDMGTFTPTYQLYPRAKLIFADNGTIPQAAASTGASDSALRFRDPLLQGLIAGSGQRIEYSSTTFNISSVSAPITVVEKRPSELELFVDGEKVENTEWPLGHVGVISAVERFTDSLSPSTRPVTNFVNFTSGDDELFAVDPSYLRAGQGWGQKAKTGGTYVSAKLRRLGDGEPVWKSMGVEVKALRLLRLAVKEADPTSLDVGASLIVNEQRLLHLVATWVDAEGNIKAMTDVCLSPYLDTATVVATDKDALRVHRCSILATAVFAAKGVTFRYQNPIDSSNVVAVTANFKSIIGGSSPPATVTSVAIDNASYSAGIGTSATLTATVTMSDGTPYTGGMTWQSSSPAMAAFANASLGGLEAKAAGAAQITVSAGGVTSSAITVTVTAAPVTVSSVAIVDSSYSAAVGDSKSLSAIVTMSDGTTNSSGLSWASSTTAVAAFANSANGNVEAKAVGTAEIRASAGGKTSSPITVTVTAATATVASVTVESGNLSLASGLSQTLLATARMSDGTTRQTGMTWTSNAPSIVSFANENSGTLTANAAGSAQISASSGGVSSGTIVVTVTVTATAAAPTCSITPGSQSITSGSVAYLTVSSTGTVSSFQMAGQVLGLGQTGGTISVYPTSAATYTVSAIGPGGTGTCSATVNVTAPNPAAPTCSISPSPQTINSGSGSTLSLNVSGNATSSSLHDSSWSVLSSFGASGGQLNVYPSSTLNYNGSVTGPGGTGYCSTTVTVNAPPPAAPTCSISASSYSVTSGTQVTLTIFPSGSVNSSTLGSSNFGANGGSANVVPPNGSTTYGGSVTGPGGTGYCSSSAVTASPQVAAPTCSISPSSQSIISGQSTTLSMAVSGNVASAIFDGVGVSVSGTSQSVSPTATKDFGGQVTGPGGTTTCTARVNVKTVVTVALTGPSTVEVGKTIQMTGTATFSDGSTLDVTQNSQDGWYTNNAGVFTIGYKTGVITGVSASSTNATIRYQGVSGVKLISVTAPVPLPTCSISSSPTTAPTNSAVNLTVTGTNISSATIGNRTLTAAPFLFTEVATQSTAGTQTFTFTLANSVGKTVTCSLNVTITAPPLPKISVNVGSYAFGEQIVGVNIFGSSSIRIGTTDIQVTNTGTVLANLNVSLSGNGFQTTSGTGICGATLAVGATCSVVAGFKPIAVGAYSGSYSISATSSGGTTSPVNVALTGTGSIYHLGLAFSQFLSVNICNAVDVLMIHQNGLTATVGDDISVAVSANLGGLFANATCTQAVTATSIKRGGYKSTIYYKSAAAGTVTINASAANVTSTFSGQKVFP